MRTDQARLPADLLPVGEANDIVLPIVGAHTPTTALFLSIHSDPAPAISILQELTPEMVCFFLHESHQSIVEAQVHPALTQMPQKWDWILTPDPENFPACHKALAQQLPSLLSTWKVAPGELVMDCTSGTPAMAAAMALVGFPFSTKVLYRPGPTDRDPGNLSSKGNDSKDTAENPWDEEAPRIRKEACELFNLGWHEPAARSFRLLEHRVSGGLKPFYRALADIAHGYGLWEQFQYRPAWEKLKGAIKALELASVWGGPPGMDTLIKSLKGNLTFLERLVLDSKTIKPALGPDLLAWAKRRGDRGHDLEAATRLVLRALEAYAQTQLFTGHRLTSWDVQPDQLPADLQESCRTRHQNEIDGKYRLPWEAQFHTLAALGDPMGQRFVKEWPKMKTLIDAANHAVLGYGFEPIKAERFHQLYETVLKLCDVHHADLPVFPSLHL